MDGARGLGEVLLLNARHLDVHEARHRPHDEWGHMKAGKLADRLVSADHASLLRRAIGNYHRLKQLLRAWESESE